VRIQRRLASNLQYCHSVGMDCVPVVIEHLGGLADDTITTIRAIGCAISQRSRPFDASVQLL